MKIVHALLLRLIICLGLTFGLGCNLANIPINTPEDSPLVGAGGGSAGEVPSAMATDGQLIQAVDLVTSTDTDKPLPAWTYTPVLTATFTREPSATPVPPTNTKPPSPPPPPASPTSSGCAVTFNGSFEEEVVSLINQERANNGLPPLAGDSLMYGLARDHSTWMACNNQFSHSSSFSGENIGAGYGSPSDVVSGWMASDGHRANILYAGYNKVGIGYAFVAGSTYGHYWTAGFTP